MLKTKVQNRPKVKSYFLLNDAKKLCVHIVEGAIMLGKNKNFIDANSLCGLITLQIHHVLIPFTLWDRSHSVNLRG